MARAVIPLQEEVALRPQAAPIDTYARPARSSKWDLAEALGKFDRSFGSLLNETFAKDDEAERLKGEAAFHQQNKDGYAEGVRSGSIPFFASKGAMRGYKNAEGRAGGLDFEAKAYAEFEQWGGKNSDDPAALRKWQQETIKKHFGSNDPEVIRGFLPSIRQFLDKTTNDYVAYRSKHTAEGSLNAHVAAGFKAAQAPTLEGKPYDWKAAEKARADHVAIGGDPDAYDDAMMSAAASEATKGTGDEAALKFFDQKVPGQSYTYGETPKGRLMVETARDKLKSMRASEQTQAYTQQQREDKAASDKAKTTVLDMLAKDPKAPIPEDLIREMARADPEARSKITGWRSSLSSGVTDDEAQKQVYADIMAGKGMKAVHDAMERKVFGRPEDIIAATNFAKQWEGSKERIKEARGLDAYKSTMRSIEKITAAKTQTGDPISGLSEEGAEAQYDFERSVGAWIAKNPGASDFELEEFVNKQAKAIRDRISQPEDPFSAGEYNRDPSQFNFSNPRGIDATKEASGETVGGIPKQEPLPGKPGGQKPAPRVDPYAVDPATGAPFTDGPAATPKPHAGAQVNDDAALDYFTQQDPQTQQSLRNVAKARGMSVMDVARQLAPKAPTVQKMSFTADDTADFVNEALGTRFSAADIESGIGQLRASLADDSGAAKLLDFIAGEEAAGNYNAVFGNSKSTDDLSRYTLDEIIAQGKNGRASSAKGRYQFMQATLRDLKEELGLSGSERFTPELQDRLGLALLKRRGLDAWRAGKITDHEFADRLAKEWAALPDPDTGRSAYALDGLNAATTGVDDIMGAIEAARSQAAAQDPRQYARGLMEQAGEKPSDASWQDLRSGNFDPKEFQRGILDEDAVVKKPRRTMT
jgi:muramidase (phage lysozyme)